MRVLLVDDEEELAVTLAERLTIRGFSVDWAVTAESALKLFRDKKYDVAVLDVKLPGLSGVTLKEHMAEIDPELKFIFMTGHGSQEDFEAGSAAAGESNYLWKPVDIDAFAEKINLVAEEID
ncbi:MAG TPA: response regulator [Desulfobacteraceae bacterium]|nr:response regulator [Desulfobacteraceae bacterium]